MNRDPAREAPMVDSAIEPIDAARPETPAERARRILEGSR